MPKRCVLGDVKKKAVYPYRTMDNQFFSDRPTRCADKHLNNNVLFAYINTVRFRESNGFMQNDLFEEIKIIVVLYIFRNRWSKQTSF